MADERAESLRRPPVKPSAVQMEDGATCRGAVGFTPRTGDAADPVLTIAHALWRRRVADG